MKRGDRYDASGLDEAQFEPGSRRRVLKNLLGIKKKSEMDRIEAREQLRALQELTTIYGLDHRFTAGDICRIHKIWLGPIYCWAGQYRQVNIQKESFPFGAANLIPNLMAEFERGPLRDLTPCHPSPAEGIARALAIVHVELMLIHPFREGNGRAGRLLAVLMGLQAGLPSLFFGDISGKKRRDYFVAIRAGLDRKYEPMQRIMGKIIAKTLEIHHQT